MGLVIADVAMNPSDPPDAFATIAGRRAGVELVEFVDGNLLARIKAERRAQGEQVASVTSYHDPFFAAAQWSEDRFLAHLEKLIDRKNGRYFERGISIDCLVIYSAETWLVPQQVHRWLARARIERRANLAQVHFLMEYQPGRPGRYPLFRVY